MSAPKKRSSFPCEANSRTPFTRTAMSLSLSPRRTSAPCSASMQMQYHTPRDMQSQHSEVHATQHRRKRMRSEDMVRSPTPKKRRIDTTTIKETSTSVDLPTQIALLPPVPDLIPLEDDWNTKPPSSSNWKYPPAHVPFQPQFDNPINPGVQPSFDSNRPFAPANSPDINVVVVPDIEADDEDTRHKKVLAMFAGPENVGRKYVVTEHGEMIFRPLHMKCTHCSVYFTKTHALYQHIRTHQNHTQCPHCTKKLTCMATFVYHVRTHTGEKPYYCPLHTCDFRNAVKYNLKVHLASRRHGGKSNLKKYAKVLDEDVCNESLKKRKDDSVHELGSRRSKKRKKLEEQNKAAADAAARHHALAANLTTLPYGWSYDQMGARLLLDSKWMQDVKFNPSNPAHPADTNVDRKPNVFPSTIPPSSSPRETTRQHQDRSQANRYPQQFSSFPLLNSTPLFNSPFLPSAFNQPNLIWGSQHSNNQPMLPSPPIPPLPPVQSYTNFFSSEMLGNGSLPKASELDLPPMVEHGVSPRDVADENSTLPVFDNEKPIQSQQNEEGKLGSTSTSNESVDFLMSCLDDVSGSNCATIAISPLPVPESVSNSPVKNILSPCPDVKPLTKESSSKLLNSGFGFMALSTDTSISPPCLPPLLTKDSILPPPVVGLHTKAFHLQPDDANVSNLFSDQPNPSRVPTDFLNFNFSLANSNLQMDDCKDESPSP